MHLPMQSSHPRSPSLGHAPGAPEMVFAHAFGPGTLEFSLVIGFKFVGEHLIGNWVNVSVECKLLPIDGESVWY